MLSSMLLCVALAFTSPSDGVQKTPAPVRPDGPDLADISGFYACKGREASGGIYTGVAVVTKRGDVYVVQWTLSGGSSYTGVGMRQGDKLVAGWAMPKEDKIFRGVNSYTIQSTASGPVLNGRWAAIPGNGQQHAETLTFLKKLEVEEDE